MTMGNAPRVPSTPTEGMVRAGFAGLLGALAGWGVQAAATYYGVDPALAQGAALATVPAVTGTAARLGKEARDFNAQGRGGAIRFIWSKIF